MKLDSVFYKFQLPVLVAVVIACFAIRSSVIETYRIPTSRMLPTLLIGDFLFANKMEYGLHVPFSESWGKKPWNIGTQTTPQYGDVIIFTPVEAGEENHYIRRVIGLPGDKIHFEGKVPYINGQPVERTEITGKEKNDVFSQKGFDPEGVYQESHMKLYREKLPNGKTYSILEDTNFEAPKQDDLTIPPENYYVLGDNRDDSKRLGVLSINSIRGRAFVIWLSYRISLNDSNWSFRDKRIGLGF